MGCRLIYSTVQYDVALLRRYKVQGTNVHSLQQGQGQMIAFVGFDQVRVSRDKKYMEEAFIFKPLLSLFPLRSRSGVLKTSASPGTLF